MSFQKSEKYTLALILLWLFTSLLGSCRNLGTAVVLWPAEESQLNPGDLVSVVDESLLRESYIINIPGQKKLKNEIDKWRIRLFSKKEEAISWAAEFNEWKNVYAECQYQGLPMRSEASNLSRRIYRFKKDDTLKILSREPGPIKVGNLEGYWYNVLAEGGVQGFVFDYHLKVFRIENGNNTVLNKRSTDDPILDNILADVWRPAYFNDMIQNQRIDLKRFRSDYGLFLNSATQNIVLKLPEATVQESWTEILSTGSNRYDFMGSSFSITSNSENFISIRYKLSGNEYFDAFVRIDEDIDSLRESEQMRRDAIGKKFIENGPNYSSQVYGSLRILAERRFNWSRKSSVISRGLLSSEAGNTGRFEFDLFMNQSIAAAHEGVVTFHFDNGEQLHFLYAFENGGLRFIYVPDSGIEDDLVQTDQFIDPIRLFFIFTESGSP